LQEGTLPFFACSEVAKSGRAQIYDERRAKQDCERQPPAFILRRQHEHNRHAEDHAGFAFRLLLLKSRSPLLW
jgi:hypothetical protein